jgi:hypothetical protein
MHSWVYEMSGHRTFALRPPIAGEARLTGRSHTTLMAGVLVPVRHANVPILKLHTRLKHIFLVFFYALVA